MIIDQKKFDLRIYLVLTGMFPMKAYLFEEGLVRFCTSNYEEPNTGNMYNQYIHLTNSAINKHSKDYKVDTDNCYSEEDTSTNRFLSTVYKKLQMDGQNIEMIQSKIRDIAQKVCVVIEPMLSLTFLKEGKTFCS